jgi:hypothetical protein
MKVAIICGVCGKLKRLSNSFQVKITDFKGEAKEQIGVVNGKLALVISFPEHKVRVCRDCAVDMGYKIKAEKALKILGHASPGK